MMPALFLSFLLFQTPGERMASPVTTSPFESFVFSESVICYWRPIYSDMAGQRMVKCYDDRGRLIAQTRHQNVTITWTTP